jgi:hypothetical protein
LELLSVKKSFLLPCRCGNKVPIEKTQAGQQVRCSCGLELDVPTMQAIGRLEPAPVEGPTAKAASRWGLWQGLVLLGAAIALPAIGWAAYLGLSWPKARTVDIEKLSPTQALSAWHVLRTDPSRRVLPFDEYPALIEAQKVTRYWLIVATALFGIGLATAAGALLLARPRALQQADWPEDD